MPLIELTTVINAPIGRCFDLSRSIDLHKISTEHTDEEAIGGVTSGLIGLGETVTWRARHFGVKQDLTTEITEYSYPLCFVDEMTKGVFKSFRHEHNFTESNDLTIMLDLFDYQSPFGLIGKIVDRVILEKYMTSLLFKRNETIKDFAESERWKEVLGDQ